MEIFSIHWFGLLFLGLSFFFYGILNIGKNLKLLLGEKIKTIIAKETDNKLKGVIVGFFLTIMMQSSSATTALTVSLVSASLISFPQSIGIILGANIGSTLTSFFISFDIIYFTPFIISISVILIFIPKIKIQLFGKTLFSTGLLFLGLDYISNPLSQISDLPHFIQLINSLSNNPFLGLFIGTLATGIISSSTAFIGIIQKVFNDQTANLLVIIPLILGCNIGTTLDAILASIGGNKDSKKVALFHLLFNLLGAILFMILLYPFALLINFIQIKLNLSLKITIAAIHFLYNLLSVIIFYFFIDTIIKMINKIITPELK